MTEIELLSILKSEGWSVGKDEVGDSYCSIKMESLLLQVLPAIKKRTDHFRVSLNPSISSVDFSQAVDRIFGRKEGYAPIIVSNFAPEKIANPSVDDIVRLSQEAVAWGKSQDIGLGLQQYRELPTSSKGARPLRHLAALAIHGDVEKLSFYKESFANGDRLGFVPYITVDMVEEALAIAKDID